MNQTTNQPYIILGMHRSGTSCLAGILQNCGIYLGNVSEQNEYNQKGNREHSDIMKLNDELLEYNGGSWRNPPGKIAWNQGHQKQALEITNQLNNDENQLWGFKDPRTLITIDFWKTLYPDSVLVGTIRNPIDVHHSLARRDPTFSPEESFELWYKYNTRLLKIAQTSKFPLVDFNESDQAYKESIRKLLKSIFISDEVDTSKLDFFESHLRNQAKSSETIEIPQKVRGCHQDLLKHVF